METLTVTLTESITMDAAYGGDTISKSNVASITGINQVMSRVFTCPAADGGISGTTIAKFSAAANTTDGATAIDLENTKYVRVTNLDSSNSVTLSLQISDDEDGAADHSTSILLEAGKSFMMGAPHDGIATADDSAAVITDLHDLESLIVDPAANDVAVELFIAGAV